MGEIGRVIGIEGDKVLVSMKRSQACEKCGICSIGTISTEMNLSAQNMCGAKINDFVNIELEQSDFLKAVLIMYGIPLMALFLGSIFGFYSSVLLGLSQSAIISFVLGLICMSIAFLWIRSREKRWKDKDFILLATNIIE